MVKKLSDIFEDLENPAVLLIGPPRTGKHVFALELLRDSLEKNEGVVCILTNTFPEDFLEGTQIPKEKMKLLKIIDCYSHYAGIPLKESSTVYRVDSPTALSDISLKTSKSISELSKRTNRIRIIANSLSTLLAYNTLENITKFLQIITSRMKVSTGISLFVVEEGMHDPKYVAAITSLTNMTVRLESRGREKYIIVIKVTEIRKPIKYNIVDNKIILGE